MEVHAMKKPPQGRHEQLTDAMRAIDEAAQDIGNILDGHMHLDAKCRAKIRDLARAILEQVDRHEALDR